MVDVGPWQHYGTRRSRWTSSWSRPWRSRRPMTCAMSPGRNAASMRRHDLLRVEPPAWQAMLDQRPGLSELPLVADWVSCDWPVMVRRSMAGDPARGVPAALPLPPCFGKLRVGFSFPSDLGIATLPSIPLRDAARSAPAAWQATIAALDALGEAVGTVPRVFGALLGSADSSSDRLNPAVAVQRPAAWDLGQTLKTRGVCSSIHDGGIMTKCSSNPYPLTCRCLSHGPVSGDQQGEREWTGATGLLLA